jgi:hypothetical protein
MSQAETNEFRQLFQLHKLTRVLQESMIILCINVFFHSLELCYLAVYNLRR